MIIHRSDSIVNAQKAQRRQLEAAAVASIAFTALAESGQIDETTANRYATQFQRWDFPVNYAAGQLRSYGQALYRCLQSHTSQEDWAPPAAASLWREIGDPAAPWPAWSQPIGAGDAYAKGDRVSHSGKHWQSSNDSNVWEPGVYGWDEVNL